MLPGVSLRDSAWDILLGLLIAEVEGRRVSVSSACIAARLPATSALRQVSMLEAAGLIERQPGVEDRRRTYVRLSGSAQAMMLRYFEDG